MAACLIIAEFLWAETEQSVASVVRVDPLQKSTIKCLVGHRVVYEAKDGGGFRDERCCATSVNVHDQLPELRK